MSATLKHSFPIDALAAVPTLREHEGFIVVRDDKYPGGTKRRALDKIMPHLKEDEIIYAAHAYGYGQIALAYACELSSKRLTLFYPKTPTRPQIMLDTLAFSCVTYREIDTIETQEELYKYAQIYSNGSNRYLIPVGFDMPFFHQKLIHLARSLPIEKPKEVWALGGSGTLVRALIEAWPNATINAVSMGFTHGNMGSAIVHQIPEAPEQESINPPPYSSASYYDAKIWQFVKKYGRKGALVWNVA